MRPILAAPITGVLFLVVALASPAVAAGQEATRKPLLSEEIRAVLERDGAEAAQRRFDEIFPAHKDDYEVDVKGFVELANEYIQAGDASTAQTIMQMSTAIAHDMIAGASTQMPAAPNPPQPDPPQHDRHQPPPAAAHGPDRGPARDDLGRFSGVYGAAEQEGSRRDLFVTESCDGHLVVGAMWGDAANWWMTAVSDHAFEMSDSFRSLRVEFEIGPDGKARSMSHDLDGLPTPLPRAGPLPQGWEGCVQREGG